MKAYKLVAMLALALSSASANATTFVRYDITALGEVSQRNTSGKYLPLLPALVEFSYIFDASKSVYSFSGGSAYGLVSYASYSADKGSVSFYDSHSAHHYFASYRASFCADTSEGFPTTFSGAPSCGWLYAEYSNWNQGDPLWTQINASITNVTVSSFNGNPLQTGLGLVRTSLAVPEPKAWVMMLTGFALLGGTLRYRRRSMKVASA